MTEMKYVDLEHSIFEDSEHQNLEMDSGTYANAQFWILYMIDHIV